MHFSSPCIGTPGGFEQGGMKSVSSGSKSSHADNNSVVAFNLILRVLFSLYGHPLNKDMHLDITNSFLIVSGERKALLL